MAMAEDYADMVDLLKVKRQGLLKIHTNWDFYCNEKLRHNFTTEGVKSWSNRFTMTEALGQNYGHTEASSQVNKDGIIFTVQVKYKYI